MNESTVLANSYYFYLLLVPYAHARVSRYAYARVPAYTRTNA
jgi:hypothetical protein